MPRLVLLYVRLTRELVRVSFTTWPASAERSIARLVRLRVI